MSSESCQRRARFQQHRDAICHKFLFFLQGKAPKEIHAIVTETLACFLPGRPKDLSAPLYLKNQCSLSLRPVRIIVKSAY